MGVPSFFKQDRPRGFNFIPRYYNPDKEAHEERVRRIRRELGMSEEGGKYVPGIQRGMMANYFKQKERKVQRYTTIRLIVILLILFLIAYVFLYL